MKFQAACVQFNIKTGDVQSNLNYVSSALKKLSQEEVKLVVLPELWTTRFDNEAAFEFYKASQEAIGDLSNGAKKYGMVIVGSVIEKKGEDYFNTAYVFGPSGGTLDKYRKVHLFSMWGEHTYFKKGKERVVVDTSLGKLGIIICYDLRFPELIRKLALEGAQVLVVPAQWPTTRVYHWRVLNVARAIENQFFVVACNRTGEHKKELYPGASLIIDPFGEVLAEGNEKDGVVVAEIDLDRIKAARGYMRCFDDRAPEVY